jgi:hypothetical protein
MASKKRTPNDRILVSLTFKDIPSWKLKKLFINNNNNNMKQKDFTGLENEMHVIENALADEFSFLFYIGLLRYNNHKASNYPLTTGFIRPNAKSIIL